MTRSGAHRPMIALLLVGALSAALGGFSVRSADAASPAPAAVELVSIRSGIGAPAGTAPKSVPSVLAAPGTPLTLEVSFTDSSGFPASFSKDTPVTVTASSTAPSTEVRSIDTVVSKNLSTDYLQVSVSAPTNRVTLTVSFTAGKKTASGTGTQVFDVVSELRPVPVVPGDSVAVGIGGNNDSCAQATALAPVCGVFVLPRGTKGSQVLMSLGSCEGSGYTKCTDGAVVQALADLTGYSTTAPATFLLRCDKTLCGTGPIRNVPVFQQTAADAPLEKAGPCPAKNTVGDEPCVDYVQSKRDGSGDTYFYVLFADDARVSVG